MKAYFTTKDLAFIGVTAGILVVMGMFVGRLGRLFVLGLPIPGTHGLANGPLDAFFGVIAAAKTRKIGTFTLIGIIENMIKIMIGKPIYMVLPAVLGFVITDLVMLSIGHKYCCSRCTWFMGGIMLGSRFIMKIGLLYLVGLPALKIIQAYPLVTLWVLFLSFALGTLGSLFGSRIVKELRKAGVIE